LCDYFFPPHPLKSKPHIIAQIKNIINCTNEGDMPLASKRRK
jgi:hypothetical protein